MKKHKDCFGNEIELGSLIAVGQHYDAETEIGVPIRFTPKGLVMAVFKYSQHRPGQCCQTSYNTVVTTIVGWIEPTTTTKEERVPGSTNSRILVLPKTYLTTQDQKLYNEVLEEYDLL